MRSAVLTVVVVVLLAGPTGSLAQFGGGAAGYGQQRGRARAEQDEALKRALTQTEIPPAGSMFVDANVLMNIKADAYVAVFGITQEGATPAECGQKMGETVRAFTTSVRALGIAPSDVFVDFVVQNKVYGYELGDNVAREKLAGFELKKNVSIHFRDYTLLDKLILAAAQSQIYDLIKVDYVVKDIAALQDRLMEEASRVLKQKVARHERLLGTRLLPPAQVYAERSSVYYPSEMYDSYVAAESENVSAGFDRQRYVVQSARKTRTFYFNALSPDGYDVVVNPVVIEPVVQATLYLKARYQIAGAGKSTGRSQAGGSRRSGSHRP